MSLRPRRSIALVAMLALAAVLPAAQQDQGRTAAELKALTERIQRVQQQVQKDAVEKNRQTRELRDAERAASRAQAELARLRSERGERVQALQRLAAERRAREAERDRTAAELAGQLRAAYFMGRSEPLKLLLNQRNPAQFSRNLAYYGYLGRLRADQIQQIKDNIASIDELTVNIEAEEAKLAQLEQQQQERVTELDSARSRRSQVLASLEKESQNRAASLKRMQSDRQEMERLLERLSRATAPYPYDPKAPFVQARGRLSWPTTGKIIVNYGATITGLGASDGVDIDTDYGAPVRAIHEGLVEYADWAPGRGQLVILNHGNGYRSIYGHLGQLHVEGGSRIAAGELVGLAGDSGGRKRAGLYFQIRRNKTAVDPRGWFRTAAPPAG